MSKTNRPAKDQSGFVSIMVTIVIMSIMTLVVIGFATLMRREQRQALDRQLSAQAFYAAESGINDAIKAIDGGQGSITSCPTGGAAPLSGYNNVLDASSGVEYTCVLIDGSPTSLVYDSVATDHSTIVPIRTSGPIGSLRISWQDASGGTSFSPYTGGTLPQATNSWGSINTGILRAQIIPVPSGNVTRSALTVNAQTLFLYPNASTATPAQQTYFANNDRTLEAFVNAGGGTYGDYQTKQGAIVNGNCHTNKSPRYCNAIVSNLNAIGTNTIYLRLSAIYKPVAVTVQAYTSTNASGSAVAVSGAQRVIDVTGKANDVLRRIQVRKPAGDNLDYLFPEYALEATEDICKRLSVWPGGAQIDSSVLTNNSCNLN